MSDPVSAATDVITQMREAQMTPAASTTSATTADARAAKPVQTFQARLAAAAASLKEREPAGAVPNVNVEPRAAAVTSSLPNVQVELKGEHRTEAAPQPPSDEGETKESARTTTAETTTEAAKEHEQDPKIAKRFAELKRAQRRHDERMRADREALAKQRAEIESGLARMKEFEEKRARAKDDPQAWLKEAGLTFEEAAQRFIAEKQKPAPTPEEREARLRKELEEELLAKVRGELESTRQKETEQARAQHLDQIRQTIVARVQASDEYPMVKLRSAESEILDYARAVYEKGDPKRGFARGTDLKFEKAAEVVETWLRQDAEKRFGKERVAAFLGMQPSQEASKTAPAEAIAGKKPGKPAGKTLSNDRATSAASGDDWTQLSLEERKRKAAQLLRGARK